MKPLPLLPLFLLIAILQSFWVPRLSAQESCQTKLDKKTEKIYQDGVAAYKKRNFSQTAILMKQVLNVEPGCVDAYFLMGMSNVKKPASNFKEAEKNFMKVIELCPGYDVYAYYYLGEINYSVDNFKAALVYLNEFLKEVDKIKNDADYNRAVELVNYSKFYLDVTDHPVPFNPQVVEGISTGDDEYLAIISPDNHLSMFTRKTMVQGDKNSVVQELKYKEKFMISRRDEEGIFSSGEEMPDPFNIIGNQGGVTMTADNNTLFLTICKYDQKQQYTNCDVFFSENVGGYWSPIKSVSNRINLGMSFESQPSISADGKVLYFVSDRNGGYGGMDIYRSIKNDLGEWGTPINLGSAVNSSGDERTPFLHPDGKTLYFSSNGWTGLGGFDIFLTHQNDAGAWTKLKNIGFPINSVDDEVGFFVSTDGLKGFFSSNKYGEKGGWDLYSFDLYEDARPEKVLFIKGTVKSEDSDEPVKARIELKNVETKSISEIPLDSTTGNYVAVRSFTNDYIMTVKKEGYVNETKYIARVDSTFKVPAKVDMEIKPIELNKSYRINDIYFPFNSYDLTQESKAVLDQLIEFLSENPAISIQIQGHTDNIGKDDMNLKLSDNRAKSVYSYLISNGIEASRLTYKGYGESEPVATNDTEEGRARNRRTVFVITRK